MLNEQDHDLITKVQDALDNGKSVNAAAGELGFDNANTLYQKLYRLGYKIECTRRLVPIHAAPIPTAQPAQQ